VIEKLIGHIPTKVKSSLTNALVMIGMYGQIVLTMSSKIAQNIKSPIVRIMIGQIGIHMNIREVLRRAMSTIETKGIEMNVIPQ